MQNKINPQFQLWDLKEKQERNRFNGLSGNVPCRLKNLTKNNNFEQKEVYHG